MDDGSRDQTAQVLEALSVRYAPYLRVITHATNRGYGGALRSGAGLVTAAVPAPVRWLAWAALSVAVLLTASQTHSPFIYFQF